MTLSKSSSGAHWDAVYATRQPNEVSWTQEVPATSLQLIRETGVAKSAAIIDVGGGDSKLADHLLAEGYENITVLDISEKALEKAKARLGKLSERVKWIVTDITSFEPADSYAVWHDRATFHFLTSAEQVQKYVTIAGKAVSGYLIVGTFSHDGPQQCSGLTIQQYNEDELQQQFAPAFIPVKCITELHITPFNTPQHFQFCSFKARTAHYK